MKEATTRTLDTKSALSILKDFYLEAKKEIKKREKVQFSLEEENELCGALRFSSDDLLLFIQIKEGGLV